MKRISVRDFQLHAKKYLKELPLKLTQYNIPVATIIPFAEDDIVHSAEVLTINKPNLHITPPTVDTSVNTTVIPPIEETSSPIESKIFEEEPVSVGLSGKARTCPICNEKVPVELIRKHYDNKHEGI